MNPAVSRRLGVAAGLAALVASSALLAPAARAEDEAPGTSERVALALANARAAQDRADGPALAKALSVIGRAGARPLDDWKGTDPVPAWRALVPGGDSGGGLMRGSPLGPGYRTGQVSAGRSDRFEQVFLSGRKATIALSTPGDTPLTLQVLDADRKPVCSTGDKRRACRWVPIFTQRYVIEVRNGGNRLADYFLVVE